MGDSQVTNPRKVMEWSGMECKGIKTVNKGHCRKDYLEVGRTPMQCKCGALIQSREHEVTTLAGAQSWVPDAELVDLPMRVVQWECPACGRYKNKIDTPNYQAAEGSGA